MKYTPYSFSKLSVHKQCPRKFKYNYIDKRQREPQDIAALLKGGAVHNMLEKYPQPGTHKLTEKYQHVMDKFLEGQLSKKYLTVPNTREIRFGMTEELEPCAYSDNNCMFRGAVDYICIIDGVLHLIDWKTGKLVDLKYQNFDQLMFYAVYFFSVYKEIQTINISYVYIEHNEENVILLQRKFLKNYTDDLINSIKETEDDIQFNKTKTRLCGWCPYKQHCSTE